MEVGEGVDMNMGMGMTGWLKHQFTGCSVSQAMAMAG